MLEAGLCGPIRMDALTLTLALTLALPFVFKPERELFVCLAPDFIRLSNDEIGGSWIACALSVGLIFE